MNVFIIFVFIALLLWFHSLQAREMDNDGRLTKICLYILTIMLIVIAGARGSTVGADTPGYVDTYESMKNKTFEQFTYKGESGEGITNGYFVCSYLFYSWTHLSWHWWFAVVSAVYMFTISSFCIRYSRDPIFALLAFLGVGLYSFSLAGQKQTLGMSFALMSWMAFDQRKWLPAILLLYVAYWFHTATVIFLGAYILYFFVEKKYYYTLVVAIMGAVFLFGPALWKEGLDTLNNQHYSTLYGDTDNIYSNVMLIFFSVLVGCSLYYFKNYRSEQFISSRLMYGYSFVAIALFFLCMTFSTAFRLAYYFAPFTLILLSNCSYDKSKNKINITFELGIMAMILFFFFYTSRDSHYIFFWEE